MSKVRINYDIKFPSIQFSARKGDLIDSKNISDALTRSITVLDNRNKELYDYKKKHIQIYNRSKIIQEEIKSLQQSIGDVLFNAFKLEYEYNKVLQEIKRLENLEDLEKDSAEEYMIREKLCNLYAIERDYKQDTKIAYQAYEDMNQYALKIIIKRVQHDIKRRDFANSQIKDNYTVHEYLEAKHNYDLLRKTIPGNMFSRIEDKAKYIVAERIIKALKVELNNENIDPSEKSILSHKIQQYQHMYNKYHSSFQYSQQKLLSYQKILFNKLTQFEDIQAPLYNAYKECDNSMKKYENLCDIIGVLENYLKSAEDLRENEEVQVLDSDKTISKQPTGKVSAIITKANQEEDYDSDRSVVTFLCNDDALPPFELNNPFILDITSEEDEIISTQKHSKKRKFSFGNIDHKKQINENKEYKDNTKDAFDLLLESDDICDSTTNSQDLSINTNSDHYSSIYTNSSPDIFVDRYSDDYIKQPIDILGES